MDASTGASRVYLRPGASALAAAWAAVASGLVEPSSAIPEAILHAAPYPVELFQVQASYVEQRLPEIGSLGGPPGSRRPEVPATDVAWSADTAGPVRIAVYEKANERLLGAVLTGVRSGTGDELRLTLFDSATALQTRAGLESRWSRFASYDALSDSIGDDGGKLERGPVRIDLTDGGAVAYQSHFAVHRATRGDSLLGQRRRARRPARRGAKPA